MRLAIVAGVLFGDYVPGAPAAIRGWTGGDLLMPFCCRVE
jgi:hypothetical protein